MTETTLVQLYEKRRAGSLPFFHVPTVRTMSQAIRKCHVDRFLLLHVPRVRTMSEEGRRMSAEATRTAAIA